jgi:F-type H+-transporting ATPase subunit b
MHLLLADSGIAGLLTALVIDGKALALNAAAFLVVVWVMGRFVYPPLMKAIDAKRDELEATAKAKTAADQQLQKAETTAAKIIAEARAAADAVVAESRDEADQRIKAAERKAEQQADRIVAEAREQLAQDVAQARRQLKAETAQLVVSATEAVLGDKLDDKHDAQLVARALESKQA